MKNYLAFFLLLTVTAASAHGPLPARLAPRVRSRPDGPHSITDTTAGGTARLCEQVTFSRGLRYGESEANVLDVATSATKADTPRPVLLFVAGDTFTGDRAAPDLARQIEDQVMCFAARNEMIGVRVNYRLAPAATWPMGRDRCRGGAVLGPRQYRPVQRRCPRDRRGRLRRRRLPCRHPAGASRGSRPTAPRSPPWCWCRASTAQARTPATARRPISAPTPASITTRSVFPGILNVDVPIVLAWAADDPASIVAQGETLKKTLCGAGHCPRDALLRSRDGIAAAFGLDGLRRQPRRADAAAGASARGAGTAAGVQRP